MTDHNRIYTILLIVAAVLYGGVVTLALVLSYTPEFATPSRPIFVAVALAEGLYVAAMAVALFLRASAPAAGRVATLILNVIMLPLFPLGTALAIYGLLKVDKGPRLLIKA
jgi:hypothetical protein